MTADHADRTYGVPDHLIVEPPSTAPGIIDITHDSRQVNDGWAFACVPGERHDGHDYAADAVRRKASLLVVDRRLDFDALRDIPQLIVTDVRRAMGFVAARVHGHPARELTTIGVTGTNGKTTTTRMVAAILRHAGREPREIGTLSGPHTTPESPDLQRMLRRFVTDGADTVVMEVSSHALALHRVTGMHFDVSVFTNLGRDHLDLHGTIEDYFRAKASLFEPDLTSIGVVNRDDPSGRLIADAATIDMVSFGLDDAEQVVVGVDHHRFVLDGQPFRVPVGGEFNVRNSLAAVAAARALGVDLRTAAEGLADLPAVPGRFEVVSSPDAGVAVVVDYAHTPDGIENLLESARSVATGKVIAVVGCGGDRDRDKRPLMGSAAATGADLVVVTSDNPRSEDPASIVEDIVRGVPPGYRGRVSVEVDRRQAIAEAIGLAARGDVVVIAGKGHETTQTVSGAILDFDDRKVAREILGESGGTT